MIPTLDELTRIYIKVMDDQMRGKSLSEIAMAGDEERTYLHPGIAAVRDAVLEGAVMEASDIDSYVLLRDGTTTTISTYIRSLKGSPE